MYQFGEKHPVIFEIILTILSFLAAAVFVAAGSILNVHPDFCSSVGRIIVGAALMLLYRRAFTGIETKKNYLILLPALLFAAWNLFYNLSLGLEIGGSVYFMEAALTAFAPALFEEVLFRGIFLYNLKKTGRSSDQHRGNGRPQRCYTVRVFTGHRHGPGSCLSEELQYPAGHCPAFPDRFYAPYLCGTGCISHYHAYRPVRDPAGGGSGLRR